MNEPKICPKCGTPQQWEMWRYCGCGHDFDPTARVVVKVEERREAQTPREPEPEEYLTGGRVSRWLWRLYFAAGITLILTKPFHTLHWLASAAACGLVTLFLIPMSFLFRKR